MNKFNSWVQRRKPENICKYSFAASCKNSHCSQLIRTPFWNTNVMYTLPHEMKCSIIKGG